MVYYMGEADHFLGPTTRLVEQDASQMKIRSFGGAHTDKMHLTNAL